jgi:hypothetical protein
MQSAMNGLAVFVRSVVLEAKGGEFAGAVDRWLPSWLDRHLPNADFESDTAPEQDRAPAAVV